MHVSLLKQKVSLYMIANEVNNIVVKITVCPVLTNEFINQDAKIAFIKMLWIIYAVNKEVGLTRIILSSWAATSLMLTDKPKLNWSVQFFPPLFYTQRAL